jgi:hypothetical protein
MARRVVASPAKSAAKPAGEGKSAASQAGVKLASAIPASGSTATKAAGGASPVGVEEIRLSAYLKWVAVGKPEGDGSTFWVEAERELRKAS